MCYTTKFLVVIIIIIIKNEKITVTLFETAARALYIKCVLMVRERCKGETS